MRKPSRLEKRWRFACGIQRPGRPPVRRKGWHRLFRKSLGDFVRRPPEELVAEQFGNDATPLEKVRSRLEESKISELEFLEILKFSRLPEAQNLTSLSSVPEQFLVMALSGWDTVEEIAAELREHKTQGK